MDMMTSYRTRRNAGSARLVSCRWIYVVLVAVCLGYAASPVAPVEAQHRQMQLSLREATAFALQENLAIQIAGLDPRIREAQVTEAKGIFDVEGKAEFVASDSRLLETSSVYIERVDNGLVGQDNSQEEEFSFGISQLTPYGGTYGIDLISSHLDTTRRVAPTADQILQSGDPHFVPRNEYYQNAVELRVTQPLLKNFGSLVTRNQILIAQNNFTISQEDFRQRVIAVASQVQQTYWDLVFRRQDLEVRQQQLELAQKLLAQIRRQVAVGTLAPIEVLQAETNIASTRESIIVAENAVRNAEDRLRRVMNFSLTGTLADVELLPVDTPTYTEPVLDQEEQNRQALQQRPELKQAKLVLENQHITLVFNKNQALPTLDLEASFRFNGIDTGFGGSFDQIEPFHRNRWEVGVVLRYPLANSRAKSRVQQSRLAVRQQMLRIKNLEEDVIAEVRAAVRDVLTNAQRVRASRSASRLAQRQLEAEEKKLQVGLATVFTVLDFQDRLAVERSNEVNALTEYMKSLVRLEEVKGSLLESYNIVLLSDGPRLR
jgi:outer membrane protein